MIGQQVFVTEANGKLVLPNFSITDSLQSRLACAWVCAHAQSCLSRTTSRLSCFACRRGFRLLVATMQPRRRRPDAAFSSSRPRHLAVPGAFRRVASRGSSSRSFWRIGGLPRNDSYRPGLHRRVATPHFDTPPQRPQFSPELGPFLLPPMKRPPTEAALTSAVPGEARSSAPSFPALIPVAARL
jgi:hypothetical protein